MRIIRIILFILPIMAIIMSCEKGVEYEEIGNFYFKYSVNFDSKGGEKSFSINVNADYRSYFVYGCDGIIEDESDLNEANNFILVAPNETRNGDTIDGEWYHGTIPNLGKSARAILYVDKNTTGKERKATIKGVSNYSDGRKSFNIFITQK